MINVDASHILLTEHATHQDLLLYVEEQFNEAQRMTSEPVKTPEQFLGEGETAINQYRQAQAWWPKPDSKGWPAIPENLACPTLLQLCAAYHLTPAPQDATFISRLHDRANAVVTWFQANNIQLGESKEERAARLNRERVARWQAKQPKSERPRGRPRTRNHPAVLEAKAKVTAIKAERVAWLNDWAKRLADAQLHYETLRQNPPAE